MSLIDGLLGCAILAVPGFWIFHHRGSRRLFVWAPFVLAVLAALQLAVEGLYWQFLPGYLLILTTALLAFRYREAPASSRLGRMLVVTSLIALMLLAAVPWVLVPVPRLTRPAGHYAVGTEIYRWTDSSRPEEATEDPHDKRSVIVQAWYPIAPAQARSHSTYIDGLRNLPSYVTLIPRFVMRHYDRIDTNGATGATISGDRSKWPAIVFSPGYGGPRAFYTSLVTGLASRGYIVLAIDHPFEAAVTELADGRIAGTVEHFLPSDPNRIAFMTGRLELRVADVSFVLDQLGRPGLLRPSLAGRLDLDHIGAAGHSLGGATAAVAMDRDQRIKAAANIDGTLYGAISGGRLNRPFLLLESDHAEGKHSQRYQSGNQRFLDHLTAASYRYEIHRANHYSFTDAPLFFSPPGRFLLARLLGGARDPGEVHQASAEILAAFFQESLAGTQLVEAAVASYQDIGGGRVGSSVPHAPASGY